MRLKIAKSFARIHKANLVNFGILPVVLENPADYDRLSPGDRIRVSGLRQALSEGAPRLVLEVSGKGEIPVRVELTERERRIILAGSLLNLVQS